MNAINRLLIIRNPIYPIKQNGISSKLCPYYCMDAYKKKKKTEKAREELHKKMLRAILNKSSE